MRRNVSLFLLLCCGSAIATSGQANASASSAPGPSPGALQPAANLRFVRSLASAKDVQQPLHPILDRTLDIVAGPADPMPRVDALQFPSAVVTDSHQRVFVADSGAKAVHIFDFARGKYGLLDAEEDRLGSPVALAVDSEDNLYVADEGTRTIIVYNSAGKFRTRIGNLRGGESYFESPTGIAIDRATGNLYISDTRRHMVLIMSSRGRLLARIGNRGGGNQPGNFRFPTQLAVAGGELFVLDTGNRRVQILDTAGHFRRAVALPFTNRYTGLAVDRAQNIYVTDPVVKTLQVLNREGHPLYTFDPTTTSEGEFSRPSTMWVSTADCLYVVDSGNKRRILVFQIGNDTARQCP